MFLRWEAEERAEHETEKHQQFIELEKSFKDAHPLNQSRVCEEFFLGESIHLIRFVNGLEQDDREMLANFIQEATPQDKAARATQEVQS
jgi:hypothetical protein